MRAHSFGCQLRWVCAALLLLPIPVVVYPYLVGNEGLPSWEEFESDLGTYIGAVVVGLASALVAVRVLARLPYLVLAVVAATPAGFIVAYVLSVIVIRGEVENAHFAAAIAGAFVGLFMAVAAWALLRLAHRFLSRGTCPPPSWTPPTESR